MSGAVAGNKIGSHINRLTPIMGVVGSTGIAVGDIIGSNICDILLSLGVGAMISGYSVDPVLLWFDTPFMLLIALLVLGRFTRNMRLERKETQILVLVTYFMCG